MKLNFTQRSIKNSLLILLMSITFLSLSSCAKQITFLTSSKVPAARGTVKVNIDKNKNYEVNVELNYLTEVERLVPSKKVYVLWMETDKDATINLGQIHSKVNGFSKKLKAKFQTATAFKPTKIFITAEDDAAIEYPQSETIISTDRF